MYEAHFGLERSPFRITPDTSLFYDGGKRGDILGALVYAVHRGEGIVKVVGEVGSGKTMLCRMLQLKLPKSVEIIYIANPSVSAQDILFVIAHELGLSVEKTASKHEVMHMLQDYLLQRHMEDKQVVLFIEEAQGMPLDTLEEIRLLSNLETDQNKLLQIILFGQPELDENLAQQSIRQLRERITHNFNLSPLSPEEIHKYLNFRMREVGYTGPELIDLNLAKKVEQYSDGLLRRINIIADKILLSAFAESTHNLTTKHVIAAVNDSSFGQGVEKPTRKLWWFVLFGVLMLGIVAYSSQSLWMPVIVGSSAVINYEKIETENAITENKSQSVESEVEEPEAKIAPDVAVNQTVENDIQVAEVQPQSQNQQQTEVVETDKKASPVVELVKSEASEPQKEVSEPVKLNEVVEIKKEIVPLRIDPNLTDDNNQWLNGKLQQSREWLSNANRDGVSIQVMMRRASAVRELVDYLRNEWPLDLEQTYLYEVKTDTQSIFRVFYSEFDSLANGQSEIKRLPESVKVNVPYLQSVYRMQKALL